MTSNFDSFRHDSNPENQTNPEHLTSDSFELLSAYLDGELSPSEKQQVQNWLDNDPKFKQLYLQLLALQGHLKHSVAPPTNKPIDEITAGVFESIDRTRRWRRQLIWGGGAIAATVIAGISSIFPGSTPFSSQMAQQDIAPASSQVMLAVALDRPAIHIPKSVADYSQVPPDGVEQ